MPNLRCWLLIASLAIAWMVTAGAAQAENPLETLRNHGVSDDGRPSVARTVQAGREKEHDAETARIVVINARSGGNRDRDGFGRWLARQKPDLSLVCEAANMAEHLRPAGRTYNTGLETRGRKEVAIVVRDGLRVLNHTCGKVSPDLGTGIAHDRWWARVETRVAGVKSRVYSLHLDAAIQQHDGEPMPSNRWNVTREGLEELEKRWKQDIEDGWAVIIGGDFNWNNGREHARSHPQAPGRILQRLGMSFVNTQLMWLAWTPRTHTLTGRLNVPPTNIPGLFAGEHPALLIDLRVRLDAADACPDKGGKDGSRETPSDGGNRNDGDSASPKGSDPVVQGFIERIRQLIDRLDQALKKIISLLNDTKRR